MKIMEAIETIKKAIDESAENKTDGPWKSAVERAGLTTEGDRGTTGIDETYSRSYGHLQLKFRHKWFDTSKTFSIGPDRTTMELTLNWDDVPIDSYRNSYED